MIQNQRFKTPIRIILHLSGKQTVYLGKFQSWILSFISGLWPSEADPQHSVWRRCDLLPWGKMPCFSGELCPPRWRAYTLSWQVRKPFQAAGRACAEARSHGRARPVGEPVGSPSWLDGASGRGGEVVLLDRSRNKRRQEGWG